MEMTVVPQEAFYLGTLGGGVLHNQPPDDLDDLLTTFTTRINDSTGSTLVKVMASLVSTLSVR